jgi:hypothetical protein
MLQMHFQGAQIRYQLLHPGAVTVGFRVPSAKIRQDKVNYINKLFMPQGSFRDLARDLESEWEWQKNIFYQAEEKVVRSSARFFLLPEGSNLATYMAGFLAISAALIITLVDRDVFYQELTSVASQAWSNIIILHLVIVFPLAAMIIPLAIMVVMVKNFGIWARQCVDDSYLDQVGFYKFICELVQLEENMQRRTLMRTTGFVYWFVRIGTVPLSQVRKHFHNARRSLRLAKRRRIKDLKKI